MNKKTSTTNRRSYLSTRKLVIGILICIVSVFALPVSSFVIETMKTNDLVQIHIDQEKDLRDILVDIQIDIEGIRKDIEWIKDK